MVEANVDGVGLTYKTLPDLFSPKKLDNGTKSLMEAIKDAKPEYQNALDWGTGWGAIAIYMAKTQPSASVVAIDSDIAATKTTATNAEQNGVANLNVLLSHGFDEVDKDSKFDLIASNPPTHRGREVVEDMIAQSFDRLEVNGVLLMVVEARLKPWISKRLNQVFGDHKVITRSNKHVVLMSTKVSQ